MFYQIAAALTLLAVGYLTGFQHGSDRSDLEVARAAAPVEVVVASPFTSACNAMLEAAWAIEDAAPPSLPHSE